MRYVLKNDFSYFRKKIKKISLIYLGVIVGFIIYLNLFDIKYDLDVFYKTMGLNFDISNIHPLTFTLFGIYLFYYLILMIKLFFKDIELDSCNIFLRTTSCKWYIYKVISINTITILHRLLLYILVIFLMTKMKILNDISVINIFSMDIVWVLLIQQLFIFLYLMFVKYKWIVLLSLLLLFFIDINFITNVLFISNYFMYYLITLIILMLLNYFIFEKVYIKVMEIE